MGIFNEERHNRSPHWKKRQNKGHSYFTVNAYILAIADNKRVSNIYKKERSLLGVHK
jgi:hypothetical protein